jgi:hypothetical protein
MVTNWKVVLWIVLRCDAVALIKTDVSEECIASIIMVEKICERNVNSN